jgi:ubiquinone/menaquinone biosynthesis C-methylase UbiE
MEDPADPNLMLQEYIPGGEHDVWMFNGYFDGGSDCLAGFTGRKLRQTPVYTGVTSLGVCLANDEVLRTTTRWMRELGYRGILDIGYRFDARDGLYKVLDANPRIGATFRLFTASNGLDVARALYLDITGQPVPEGRQVEGRKWMVEGGDLDSALQYRRDGKLTIRAWIASLRGVQEGSYFARDDLAPFMDASLGFLRRKSRGANGPGAGPDPPLQASVDQHFAVRADIYDRPTVDGLSYAKRRATTIQWIEELGLPRTARILDIGTGAGLTSVDFAERGFEVIATDTVSAMTEATSRLASERGVADRVRTLLADAHKLPFEDGAFDVAIAMGVLPWLHSPKQAMTEMARVLSPGGYALISVDNLFRMPDLLDPRRNPIGVTVVRWLGDALRRTGLRRAPRSNGLSRRDAPGTVETYLAGLGLTEIRRTTIGFGPITFWNHPIVPEGASVRLHRALQGLADRRVPVIRDLGGHWVILARKHSD